MMNSKARFDGVPSNAHSLAGGLGHPFRASGRSGRRSMVAASVAIVAMGTMPPCTVRGQSGSPGIAVEGGADAGGRNYRWTVVNRGGVSIVSAEFPLYRVTTFEGPAGWETACEPSASVANVQNCRSRATIPAQGIQPGGRATFTAQVAASGIVRGRGGVQFHGADGREILADGVELPQREPLGDRYTSLVGLGVVFAAIAVFRWIRSRRLGRAPAT